MEHESNEPQAIIAIRHDGWTGERMAAFLETLAETAVVAEACDAAGMGVSGAYAHRRRNALFAAAWDGALTIARERLADTLLARSMEGNVEQLYKDGELIGERHLLDNRLGLAILRRLDRLAEGGVCVSARDLPFSGDYRSPGLRRGTFDWEQALDALRAGDDDGVAHALALFKGNEVEEVEAPLGLAQEDNGLDLTDRCWLDEIDDIWLTDFPPPPEFAGYESRPWDEDDPDEAYVRACTAQEIAILAADTARARAAERAEDENLRDAWFAHLKSELPSAGEQLRSDCEPASKSQRAAASGSPSGEPD